jgi:hypothetical protein
MMGKLALNALLLLAGLMPPALQAQPGSADAVEQALRQNPQVKAMTPACQERFIAHTKSLTAGRGPAMDMRNPSDAACMKQFNAAGVAERKVEMLPAVPPDLKAECRPEFQRFLDGVDWLRVAASDARVTSGAALKAQAFRTTPCGQAYFQLMKGKEAAQWADYKNASTQLKQNMVIYWMMDKRHP